MHVLLSYNCVLTVVKYTDMLCYVMHFGNNNGRPNHEYRMGGITLESVCEDEEWDLGVW